MHTQLCLTLMTQGTVVLQTPVSMEFSSQEYWSGFPFFIPGDLLDPGTELTSLMSPTLAGGFLPLVPPGKPCGDYGQQHYLVHLKDAKREDLKCSHHDNSPLNYSR